MTGYDFEHAPPGGLRRRAMSGVLKTGLSQLVRLAVQFGSTILLARLLSPREFGLLAMVSPIIGFAALFQDLGLTQAVVQKQRLTQPEVSALFAFSLVSCAVLAAAVAAASPLATMFYHEPAVGPLMAALAVTILVSGAGALPSALLTRRMQFGLLALIDAAGALTGLGVSLAGALLLHSVWALVAGSLAGCLVPTAAFWFAAGWRPSWPRRGAGAGSALRFGANLTGFNMMNYLSRNVDNVLIGRVWGEHSLGLYDRAYKLLLLPLQQINNPVAKVMLPVLSQTVSDPPRYRQAYLRAVSQMLSVTLPGVAFMAGTADVLIPAVLGQQWRDAVPIFAALAFAGLMQMLNNPSGWLFVSQGRTRAYVIWGAVSASMSVASFLIGLPYGPVGVATAYAVCEWARTPLIWLVATRQGPVTAPMILAMAAPHYTGAAGAFAAIALLRAGVQLPPVPLLAASLAASFAGSVTVMAVFPQGRRSLSQSLDLVSRLSRQLAGTFLRLRT